MVAFVSLNALLALNVVVRTVLHFVVRRLLLLFLAVVLILIGTLLHLLHLSLLFTVRLLFLLTVHLLRFLVRAPHLLRRLVRKLRSLRLALRLLFVLLANRLRGLKLLCISSLPFRLLLRAELLLHRLQLFTSLSLIPNLSRAFLRLLRFALLRRRRKSPGTTRLLE